MAVDIDSDDAKVLAACKPSPVRKRGRKGETRFFRFHADVPSCKVAGCIDILANGRQTVMPPSVHPDTNQPYVWLTPDTLDNFDLDDLPWFTPDDLHDLRAELEPALESGTSGVGVPLTGGPWHNDDPKRMCPHGSHDRLKRICGAVIARGASPDEAVRELLKYDEENHLPVGYFRDTTRTDCFADPVSNAMFFYASNLRTFNRREHKSGRQPISPLVSGSEILQLGPAPSAAPESFRSQAWPEPEGLLKDIRDLIARSSLRDQPALALGGAVAIAAAALANRLKLQGVWPNVYVLNVAPTGAGKSFPYQAIKKLFTPERGLDLMGAGGYRSSQAILKDLDSRRERLDLIDECSGMFRMIRDGGPFQADMLDILNALWSESSSIFLAPETASKDPMRVWHPCVSTLFSTTPEGLRGSVSREFVAQGFLPRCLIFHDSEYGDVRDEPVWDEDLAVYVARRLAAIRDNGEVVNRSNIVDPKPNPMSFSISPGASKMLRAYERDCADRLAEPGREEVDRHFLSRSAQHAKKLTLIHGALRHGHAEERDVDWAVAVLAACWHNASNLLPQMGGENIQETNVMRVLAIIREGGSLSHAKLIGKTRFLKTNERNDILGSLEAEGKVRGTLGQVGGRVWSIVAL